MTMVSPRLRVQRAGSARRARRRSPDRGPPTARRGRAGAARAPGRARWRRASSCRRRARTGRWFSKPVEADQAQLGAHDRVDRVARRASVHSCERQARRSRPTVIEPKSAPDWNITPNGGPPDLERRRAARRRCAMRPADRRLEADQVAQQRRLAAAAAAEDREDLAALRPSNVASSSRTTSPQPMVRSVTLDEWRRS